MVPDALLPLFGAFRDAGGRALLVGGTVRDALLGHPGKDLDIEVHGLGLEDVVAVLRRFGHVNEVGRAFGVLKLRVDGCELDVSLPRRDAREGTGHKGIRATADPHLGPDEAARRRDLTINAIAWDPLTGAFVDPFRGKADLEAGVLRAVDAGTFGEDPLRALRVVQFAARFGFRVDPTLETLCAEMPLEELPAERVRGEVEKLLLQGRDHRAGWELARRTGQWRRVLPEWDAFPEALARVARAPICDTNRRLTLLYAAACDRNDLAETTSVLDRLRVFRMGGTNVRKGVLGLVARRAAAARDLTDTDVRRLAEDGNLDLLAVLADNDALLPAAERLGVRDAPLPVLLTGGELTALGVPAGPEMGRVLASLRARQIEGAVTTREEARAEVSRLLERTRTP